MGMSASALSTSVARPILSGFAAFRESCALVLGRLAHGLFYLAVLGIAVGLPLFFGFLVWHWLTH